MRSLEVPEYRGIPTPREMAHVTAYWTPRSRAESPEKGRTRELVHVIVCSTMRLTGGGQGPMAQHNPLLANNQTAESAAIQIFGGPFPAKWVCGRQ